MKTREVVLVGFPWHRPGDPRTPLGQASIEASLRAEGITVFTLTFPVHEAPCPTTVAEQVLKVCHDRTDVALGAYIWNEALLQDVLAALAAAHCPGRIVLGGPQISYAGPELERLYPTADLFVRGYAEQAMVALAHGQAPDAIVGVHVAGTADRQSVASVALESLTSPYLTGCLPLDFDPAAPRRFVRWETQRGCPYRCAFCQHREAGARLAHRSLALGRLDRELALFVEAGVTDIAVLDPIFNGGSHGLEVLRLARSRGYGGHVSLQCRFEGMTPAFLDALQGVDATLELGLQTIHLDEGRAVQRFNQLEVADATLRALRERNIDHEITLIYGLPMQTPASFEASVDWCLARRVPRVRAFPLMLLRGTPLERDRARWELRENDNAIPAVISSSTFGPEGWARMAAIAEALRRTEDRHPAAVCELVEVAA